MSSHALTPGRSTRLLGATVLTVIVTAPPAGATAAVVPGPSDASQHNARDAEYLLFRDLTSSQHNARVAEYLLFRNLASRERRRDR